jgi:hypothetical protein
MAAGYIHAGRMLGANGGSFVLVAPRLEERGRRAIGQWPADGFDALVAALTQRIADEPEAEARSKLQRLLDAVLGAGRDIATDVIAAAIKHSAGI